MGSLRTTQEGTAGEATRAYERAIAQAEEGFSGRGLFFSGIKKTALGRGEVEREKGITQQATQVQQQERDIGEQRTEAIEGGILQRGQEAVSQYNIPFQQAYMRRFPTTGNTLAGYTIPSYYGS